MIRTGTDGSLDRSMGCAAPAGRTCGRLARLLLAAFLLPTPAAAQSAAELELEHETGATTTRLELLRNGFYMGRWERVRRSDGVTDRLGAQLPGSLLGLEGYVSGFLEHAASSTAAGTNFELGKGPLLWGGSLERTETERFTGAYVKWRGAEWEIAGGAGDRNGRPVLHGAAYARGTRFSAVAGGSHGPEAGDYVHLAGTWHPAPDDRGRANGAWLIAERQGPRDYDLEIAFAHRAAFGHLTTWGAYGMDQWPHEKRIEVLGDVMRYFRPSIRNHERSAGLGVVSLRQEVRAGARDTTLDVRVFPLRALLDAPAARPGGGSRDLFRELLGSAMVGLIEPLDGQGRHLLFALRLDPVVAYGEIRTRGERSSYLFLQYVLRTGF